MSEIAAETIRRFSPDTIRLIVMEIKQRREMLRLDAQAAERYKQERHPMVRDALDRVTFWRAIYDDAERRLMESDS